MENLGFATRAVHFAQHPDPTTGAVIPPISLSTTFAQQAAGKHKGYEYSRAGNPNRFDFEKAVASLENGTFGLAFASGSMATTTIASMMPSGSHIIIVNEVYGGTYRYFTKVATLHGIQVSFADLSNPSNIRNYFKDNTKMVWIESPTNPTLKLVDIQEISKIVHEFKALLVVDNTFLSPYFQRPLELGADIVVQSVTKYLNGHSDVVMGIAVMRDPTLFDQLKFLQNALGGVPSPFDCYLAHRGLKTLHLRMERHAFNAMEISKFLESSPFVERVYYPGLPSHPQHELAKRQQKGFGGMIAFKIKNGNLSKSNVFLTNLKVFALAESLGGVESLAELPAVMTHASVSAEDRETLGISDSMIRLSVGIEEVSDLISDIEQALNLVSIKQ